MSLINVHYLSIISNFHVLFVGCLRVVGVRGVSICAAKASTRPEMFYFNLDWKKIGRGQMGQKDRSLNGPLWYCKTKKSIMMVITMILSQLLLLHLNLISASLVLFIFFLHQRLFSSFATTKRYQLQRHFSLRPSSLSRRRRKLTYSIFEAIFLNALWVSKRTVRIKIVSDETVA
jgi:hypothetical protein